MTADRERSLSHVDDDQTIDVVAETGAELPAAAPDQTTDVDEVTAEVSLDDHDAVVDQRLAAAEEAARAIEAEAERVRREFKSATIERDRLRHALDDVEKQKKQIQPLYERALANAELRERAESLKHDIAMEETTLRQLDHEIRSLDKQLAAASGAYRAERSAAESAAAQLRSLLSQLNDAVVEKLTFVDEESSDWSPLDELEANGQLTQLRERAFTTLQKQTREAAVVCEMKTQELADLEASTAATLQQVREQRDDAIRALIFDTQDERNRLLMSVEELITTNADQALNLKQGHVQTSAPDRAVIRPQSNGEAKGTSARRTRLKPVATDEPQVAFIAAKNKELLSEIAVLKAEMSKVGENRTEAIQTTKRLEQQIKRDKDQYSAQLQKLETQIVAEQLRLKALEKEVTQTAASVEQLTAVLKTSKRHQENTRVKTLPLPVE